MRKALWLILALVLVDCPGPIDNGPPLVLVVEPADSSTVVRGTVEVAATAADESDTIRTVEFFVDGELIGTDATGPSPYSVLWNTAPLAPASWHRIRVEAEDGAGNVGMDSVTVRIAGTAGKFKNTQRRRLPCER